MIQRDDITITEEDWERIRSSLPIKLNNEDITMIILSVLLQYVEEQDESFFILKDVIDNLPSAYGYTPEFIKKRMH